MTPSTTQAKGWRGYALVDSSSQSVTPLLEQTLVLEGGRTRQKVTK